MTEMPTDDVERVAAGLSEAQRKAVLHGDCKRPANTDCVCLFEGRADLADLKLVSVAETRTDLAWLISELGYRVRTHLQEQSK